LRRLAGGSKRPDPAGPHSEPLDCLSIAETVPTVADAADHAGVSRTTAYRYFSSQEALLAQAGIEPLIAQIDDAVEATRSITDPVARVDAAFASSVPSLLAREAQLRAMLKIALDPFAA
jgi:AcrR family transcriptional regulator